MSKMPALHIHLFGDFRIHHGDEPLTMIRQARQQALLAYLLLHRHAAQARQHLAFLLWPESSEAQALTNLRKTLTHLRQAAPLLAQAIYADHKVLQWRPPVPFTLDVASFEENLARASGAEQAGRVNEALALWAAAVDLYAGPLAPSCYDDWIIAERERLHQMCLNTLGQLVTLHERRHQAAEAIRYAQQMLRLDPLQETMHLRLMGLFMLQSDRASALRTYHTCATILNALGVEPDPETQAAYARLLNMKRPATVGVQPPGRIQGRPALRLVGRQTEWEQLQAAWRTAAQQGAHFVCMLGEAGIGKTHLAEELLTWASQQGFAVARARAYDGESRLAYAPVVEWLRAGPVRAARKQLAPVWLSEVARLAPEILSEQPAVPPPEPVTESWQRQRLWEALARALLAAPQPLLLAMDDLQWCDGETLEWLRYLLHFERQARLLVLGAARPEEISEEHPLQVLFRHLRSAEQMAVLELDRLDAAHTSILATQVAQQPLTPEAQQALYRATAGNPLFVVETMRAGLREGDGETGEWGEMITQPPNHPIFLPPKVQAVIQSRLAQLSPAGRDLSCLAAVIGRSFTFNVLGAASGTGEDGVVHALDELWQRRIVREHGGDSYDFSHDKIREVAYAGISPMRRRLLHRQVAQALEQIHAHELNMVSAHIAAHYRQAGEPAKAAVYYCRAAHEMQFGFAYEEMMAHLQQGLAMLQGQPGTAENVSLEIAMVLAVGRVLTARHGWGSSGAVEAFEKARRLCLETNNLTQLVRAQDYLQIAYADSGKFQRALELGESNLALAVRLENNAEIEGAHGSLGLILWIVGSFAAARTHLEQASVLAAVSPEAQISAHRALSYPGAFPHALALWLLGYPDTAQRLLQNVLAAQIPRAGPFDQLTACDFCVMFYYWRREWDEMLAAAQRLIALTEEYDYATYRWVGHVYATAASAALGLPNAGAPLIRQSIESVKATGIRMYEPFLFQLLAEVCAYAGQHSAGIAALDEGIGTMADTGEHLWEAETHRLRGELLVLEGRIQEAELAYQHTLAVTRQQSAKMLELRAAVSLARLWRQQGRSAEAYPLLAEIYSWFTEGFDTADLQEAEKLLAELAQSIALPSVG